MGPKQEFLYIGQLNEHLISVSYKIRVTRSAEDSVPELAVKILTNVKAK